MRQTNAAPRMAYLISRYPAVSHAFILREAMTLRAHGAVVEIASINDPDMPEESMPVAERGEARRTYYVKRHGLAGALKAHAITLCTRPVAWLRGARYALSLGDGTIRRTLMGLAYFTEALMVGRWMQAHAMNHLHVHFATAAANVGLYVKKIFGTSLSLTVHGPDEFDNVSAHWLPEKIAAADFVVCIGRYARSQVMRLSAPGQWGKFDISPLGVDTRLYRPSPAARVPGPFRILCVGRLTPAKGQHILIQAARQLRDAGFDFRITIVGDGPDRASLAAATAAADLESRVEFAGALNQTQVRKNYANADAFVLPSFAEGIPVVLMEAMACGIPCVTTRITGIPELIRSADEGLLVPPSDVDALGAALRRLIEEPALRSTIAVHGRRRVEADFQLQRNISHLYKLFSERLAPTC